MGLERPFYASLSAWPTSGLWSCPEAYKGASLVFVTALWPSQALRLSGGPEGPCFELFEVFAPEQIKWLDPVPREAKRDYWALYCLPAAVIVPRGTTRPRGSMLVCASLPSSWLQG